MKRLGVVAMGGLSAVLLLVGCGDTSEPPAAPGTTPSNARTSSASKADGIQATFDEDAWVDAIPVQAGAVWIGKRDPEGADLPRLHMGILTDGIELSNDDFGDVPLQAAKVAERNAGEVVIGFQPCEKLLRQGSEEDEVGAACQDIGPFQFVSLSVSTGTVTDLDVPPDLLDFLDQQDKVFFERIVDDSLYITSTEDFVLSATRWTIGDKRFDTTPLNAADKADARNTCVADDGTRYDAISAGSWARESGERQGGPPDYRVDVRSPDTPMRPIHPPAAQGAGLSWGLTCAGDGAYLVSGGLDSSEVSTLVPQLSPEPLVVLELPTLKPVTVPADSAPTGSNGLVITSAEGSTRLTPGSAPEPLPWLPPGETRFAGDTVAIRPETERSSETLIIDLNTYTAETADTLRDALYG